MEDFLKRSKTILYTGLVLAIFGISLFWLIGSQLNQNSITRFDRSLTLPIIGWRNDWLTVLMIWITNLGSVVGLTGVPLLAAGLLLRDRRWLDTLFLVISSIGALGMTEILKGAFQRVRPPLPWLGMATGFSFPSGHSFQTMALYGFLIYLVFRYCKASFWRSLTVALLGLLPILVGISRVYLGVHYPSDVVAGWAAGMAWVGVWIAVREKASRII